MKNVLAAVVVFGILGAIGWSMFKPKYPTTMPFEDSLGEKHSFPEYQQAAVPVALTIVSDRDTFSPRTLTVFNTLAEKYTPERLVVVAFHVEAPNNEALQAMALAKSYTFKLVSIPKTQGLGIDLMQTMGMKVIGDVGIINRKGRIVDIIETKNATQAEFEEKVLAAVKKVAGS